MSLIEPDAFLETRRLTLRAPMDQDIPRIAELASDPDIARMTLRMPSPYAASDAEAFVRAAAGQDPRDANTFLIEHDDLGPVGVIGLHYDEDPAPEVGYWIGKPYWGRGFATEALEGAVVWARRVWGKRALVSGHFADNPASGRVLEKAGFLYTGELRHQVSRARRSMVNTRRMVWLA